MNENQNSQDVNSQLIKFFKDTERSSSNKLWSNLCIFAFIIIVESVILFSLAYGKKKDALQSFFLAMIPAVVTTGAAMYQANEYDVDKEKSLLCKQYKNIIESPTSQNNDPKLTTSQESEVK
ncbi:hypothetical protein [Brunnivagina elsteri]|uniref:Uncharacterized protein n=1 Tax=Brunnivagina elsteri CCALA 953 TaxID=987040 RepID=A0A2A2TAT7_9CYAN|nr:hypothetical protein [Calothrix elsteri]PAX48234.1 hypothetical protein CK510_28480 [Calothrix elsteri CCALA 953]